MFEFDKESKEYRFYFEGVEFFSWMENVLTVDWKIPCYIYEVGNNRYYYQLKIECHSLLKSYNIDYDLKRDKTMYLKFRNKKEAMMFRLIVE